jgi:hypothetical protein
MIFKIAFVLMLIGVSFFWYARGRFDEREEWLNKEEAKNYDDN